MRMSLEAIEKIMEAERFSCLFIKSVCNIDGGQKK